MKNSRRVSTWTGEDQSQYWLGKRIVLFVNQRVMVSSGKSVNAICVEKTALPLLEKT
jgi:hypothetical protein